VVDRGISVVLDVSEMEDPDLWRFAADFSSHFFRRKMRSPSPVHIFYDECQELVPEQFERGQKAVFHALHREQKRGRSLGIGTSFISQRPQEVSKRVLNQAECVFAFQMSGILERTAIAAWVASKGLAKQDLMSSLPKLPPGTAHVWSPQWLDVSRTVAILKKRTPDVSATPKVGERAVTPKPLSSVDLQALRTNMSALVEHAHANDPAVLRQRIVELEAQLRASGRLKADKPPAAPTPAPAAVPKPIIVEKSVINATDRKQLDRIVEIGSALTARIQALVSALDVDARPSVQSAKPVISRAATMKAASEQLAHTPREGDQHAKDVAQSRRTAPKLAAGERKILSALAQYSAGRTKKQVALLCGYAHGGGGFNNYLGALRSSGLLEGRGVMRITQTGLEALGPFESLPTGAELIAHWMRQLGRAERLILEALCNAYPRALKKDELGQHTGYEPNGGGFNNALGRLRTLELIEGRGEMRASQELFE
jgi:hypothetical protein